MNAKRRSQNRIHMTKKRAVTQDNDPRMRWWNIRDGLWFVYCGWNFVRHVIVANYSMSPSFVRMVCYSHTFGKQVLSKLVFFFLFFLL